MASDQKTFELIFNKGLQISRVVVVSNNVDSVVSFREIYLKWQNEVSDFFLPHIDLYIELSTILRQKGSVALDFVENGGLGLDGLSLRVFLTAEKIRSEIREITGLMSRNKNQLSIANIELILTDIGLYLKNKEELICPIKKTGLPFRLLRKLTGKYQSRKILSKLLKVSDEKIEICAAGLRKKSTKYLHLSLPLIDGKQRFGYRINPLYKITYKTRPLV